jgi:phosphoribosylamine--glycine ligase
LDSVAESDAVIFHSGTALKDGRVVTAGGRVLAITSSAENAEDARSALQVALSHAYSALQKISFDGMQYRSDIGWRALRDGL